MRGKWTTRLAEFHAQAMALRAEIEAMRDLAETEFDKRSERWQDSERGEAAQAEIDSLTMAADAAGDLEIALEAALSLAHPHKGEEL